MGRANLSLGLIQSLLLVWSTVAAADLSTTNRDGLTRFWSAADQADRPLKVLSFGDSMADSYRSITWSLMTNFQSRLGRAGAALNNYENTLLLGLSNGAAMSAPSKFWYTSHVKIPPGGYLSYYCLNPAAGLWSDRAGVFYVAHPEGGLLSISISTNGGNWAPLATVDAAAASPVGCFTNFGLLPGNYRLRLDSLSGTNFIVGVEMLDSTNGGVLPAFTDEPGIGLSTITNVPLSIRIPILRALAPDLLIWHMKEDGSEATRQMMLECEQWWSNAVPGMDVLYVGTPWVSLDRTTTWTIDQNTVVRGVAVAHRRAYFDCMTPAVSYDWMWNQGFMADATHLNRQGSTFLARQLWNDLGFFAVGAPRKLSIGFASGNARVQFATAPGIQYHLESLAEAAEWETVASYAGTGGIVSTNVPVALSGSFFRLRLQPGL